ncbi:PAS domain-containing sensor histidine kinase [Pararoseomonas indoligenes]|uniref:histidine kinase n=1 Tax=Roseomonas indoligenes TaxID=2820811 RepID=A0A940S3T7_9PROT|nr:PAS domain-containing sensor histidine kinase [Pararoseomonas indoligenes]MBP0491305.1 PAS-domain containing protein [Pararoseomonas indoligenes]
MSDPPPSEDLYRTVLEALPHGVCVYGPDRRVRLVNAAYQRIMEGSEVAVGEHHADIIARRVASGEYGPQVEAALLLMQDDFVNPTAYEQIRTRPNGTVVVARIVPLPDGGLAAVFTDVTRRAKAEAATRQRTETLQAMLDNQPDGLALFDGEGFLIAANALAARLTGLGEETMRPGRHVDELRLLQLASLEFGDLTSPAARDAIARSRGSISETGRFVRTRPDGTVLEVRTDPMPGGGFIRAYRDVTEERRARAELEAARDAAEAASRAKSGFLATMTHELRTPLHAVIGFSEAILEETRPEAVRDHAKEVLAAGRQLLGLVDGLLEATRIEAGALSLRGAVLDPLPILRAAAVAGRRLAEGAGIAFEEALPAGLPSMRGDGGRLRQVMDALISNAVKFTPAGGRVTLSAATREGGGMEIVVSDTGIGMAQEDIPRAFEAFTQLEGGLSRRYPGSGLGLYLSRALTGAMGIGLDLHSTPGKGTTVRLAVPPVEESSA